MYGLKNVDSRATEVKIMLNVKSALLIELGLGGKFDRTVILVFIQICFTLSRLREAHRCVLCLKV